MKKKYNYLLGLLVTSLFIACSEEEVQPFSAAPGVNFMEFSYIINNDSIVWGNGYTNLQSDVNVWDVYGKGDFEATEGKTTLRVQLEGNVSDKPLKVMFKVLPVEGYDFPEVTPPAEGAIIQAGEYGANAEFTYKLPAEYNKEYRAKVVVDYEQSDVVAGTKERQSYELSIHDTFVWKTMYVTSESKWNSTYNRYLGSYGDVKVRFLYAVIGDPELFDDICYCTYYKVQLFQRGWPNYMPQVEEALEAYNAAHPGNPLAEKDGTLVTF